MTDDSALTQLKAVELSILNAVGFLCDKFGIKWWLDGGTCLGAMRHKGFIPWDDDIDIGMMRSDYDRFCSIASTELPDGYSFHDSRNSSGYAAMFCKVYKDGTRFENQEGRDSGSAMGIFVDVFPYDYLYEEPEIRSRQLKLALNAQRRSYLYHSGNITVPHRGFLGFIEKAACKALHFIERAFNKDPLEYQRQFNRAIPDSSVGAVGRECLTLAWPNMNPVSVDDIFPLAQAEFEGELYPVPRLTDKYLTTMYGDWRAIPKEEDRHTHLPLLIDFGNGEIWESKK